MHSIDCACTQSEREDVKGLEDGSFDVLDRSKYDAMYVIRFHLGKLLKRQIV